MQQECESQHPDANLRLRAAFAKYYDKSDLSKKSLKKFEHCLTVWEKLAGDPPVGDVTNQTIEAFRKAMIDKPYRPAMIRNVWNTLRGIFRKLAPADSTNVLGLGIISSMLYMKPVKIVRKRP